MSVDQEWRQLKPLWDDACSYTPPPNVQGLAGGANFRVNVKNALKAAWKTAEVYVRVYKAVATSDFSPETVIGIANSVFDAVVTTLDAVREQMTELEYVCCIVLSDREQAMTKADLRNELDNLLKESVDKDYPWWSGMTRKRLERAAQQYAEGEAFEDLLKRLAENGWIEPGDPIEYRDRHFEWDFKLR